VEVSKSNVKPPALQREFTGDDGSKPHGALTETAVPRAMPAKVPSAFSTRFLPHFEIASAVLTSPVSNCTTPEKLNDPDIRVALAD
jgi:hypothetical protein